jgi:hypothetical protein
MRLTSKPISNIERPTPNVEVRLSSLKSTQMFSRQDAKPAKNQQISNIQSSMPNFDGGRNGKERQGEKLRES